MAHRVCTQKNVLKMTKHMQIMADQEGEEKNGRERESNTVCGPFKVHDSCACSIFS